MIHGHYADAGYAGAQMARLLGVPFIFTGHSLGRVKQQTLLAKKSNKEEMETDFKFNDRVEAEEHALDTASFVVTSTFQEIEQQYELYDHYAPDRMEVIPPGVDLVKFTPPDASDAPNTDLIKDIHHFLDEPEKPAILIIARADEKKNFANLIHAYGKSKQLQEQANLIVIAGNRDDIQKLDASARKVLQQILVLIDTYELYGKVAYPKHHRPEEIPMVYRWATLRKGVFVNPAYNEPFDVIGSICQWFTHCCHQ
jgi:sucrose-phosphate synthase